MRMTRHAAALLVPVLLVPAVAACSFARLDLTGRSCPCADGWQCVSDQCVPTLDAGTDDAGRCHERIYEIGAAVDDGEREDDVWYPDGEDSVLSCGGWLQTGAPYTLWCYFRFDLGGEALPPASPSLDIHLSLVAAGGDSWPAAGADDRYALSVWLEDHEDAPAIDTIASSDPTGRLLPTAVRWPASGGLSWAPGVRHRTPNLAPLFEGLRTADGPSQHVQLWVGRGPTLPDQAVIETPAYLETAKDYLPAQLVIRWCD